LTFNFETILQAHDNAIRTFEFNHSGAFLASADQGGIVKYFQENMNCVFSYQVSFVSWITRGCIAKLGILTNGTVGPPLGYPRPLLLAE
jgi:hypothetical protein